MTVHKIKLEKEDNPEYYALFEEYNKLMDRYNSISKNISNFKVPKLLFFRGKKKL